jgi:ferredoxin-thioredoxin reductase catalytic subunit
MDKVQIQGLYDGLKRVNEPKGYELNRDRGRVDELLAGLLVNRQRYGYMSCPCRLASGDKEADRDIICPCDYRAADVAEFGSCFCNLFVSREYNAGGWAAESIPERRPVEKLPF